MRKAITKEEYDDIVKNDSVFESHAWLDDFDGLPACKSSAWMNRNLLAERISLRNGSVYFRQDMDIKITKTGDIELTRDPPKNYIEIIAAIFEGLDDES